MRILQVLMLCILLCCGVGQAAEVSHNFTIPTSGNPAVVDFTNSTLVPLFDPTLGVLSSITIDLTGTINGNQFVDNEEENSIVDGTGSTSVVMDLSTVSLGSLLSVNPVAAFFFSVSADSDNLPDFSGDDATTSTFEGVTDSASVIISDAAALAAFTGPGDVALALQALGTFTITPGGNIAGFTITRGLGTGTVTYTFQAADNGEVPEPLTFVLVGAGLAVLGLARRKALRAGM